MNRGRHRSKISRASARRRQTPRKVVRSSRKEDAGIGETAISLREKADLDKRALEYLDAVLQWAVGSKADKIEMEWLLGVLQITLHAGRLLSGSWQRDAALAQAVLRLIRSRAGMEQSPKGTLLCCLQGRHLTLAVEEYKKAGKSRLRLKLERLARPVRRADWP
jgi:hypothetical protein